jgi:large subunit GTPase 1
VVQIVDSRNPLLFRSADLEKYAGEFDPPKRCILLVNKADLFSEHQIELWQKYFDEQKIEALFWSAIASTSHHGPEEEGVSEKLKRTSLSEADQPTHYISDPNVSRP